MSWWSFPALFCFIAAASCRSHSLTLKNDQRPLIDITAYGVYPGGFIEINMSVELDTSNPPEQVVLAVYRQRTARSTNLFSAVTHDDVCNGSSHYNNDSLCFHSPTSVSFSCLNVTVGIELRGVLTVNSSNTAGANYSTCLFTADRTAVNSYAATKSRASDLSFLMLPSNGSWKKFYTSFNVSVFDDTGAGLYNVYIHRNCSITSESICSTKMNLMISLLERNIGSYLSAGEIPLPYVYFAMAGLFFVSGSGYWYIIRRSKEGLFKFHYMILAALYCKGLSLVFHGANYYSISLRGHREPTWAMIHYITYIESTVVLFLTILLVCSSWPFTKRIFNGKQKKLLLIALLLPVLASVAKVIIEETEEGDPSYLNWQRLAMVVDMLCFAAILFSVLRSVRRLTKASKADGRASQHFTKLVTIFRHYYVMVFGYIYVQEIIINIIELAEPFQYEWLSTLTREVTTFLFVIITAYKFRPATNNPYCRVPNDDEEEVLTKSSLLETVTRVKKIEEVGEIDPRKIVHGNC